MYSIRLSCIFVHIKEVNLEFPQLYGSNSTFSHEKKCDDDITSLYYIAMPDTQNMQIYILLDPLLS